MNSNSVLSKECEAFNGNETINAISDHSINGISKVNPMNPSLNCKTNSKMVATVSTYCTPFNGNGCVPRDDTSHACKAPVNGLINCNNSNGMAYSISNSADTQSVQSTQQSSQMSPFPRLSGETVLFSGSTTEGHIILTNFRVFMSFNNSKDVGLPISLPIGVIETVEFRDLYYLYIYTKHVRSFICSFGSGEECSLWYKRLLEMCSLQTKFDNLFCFKFFIATKSENKIAFIENKQNRSCYDSFCRESKRMGFGFDLNTSYSNKWRVSDINKEFKLCASYPKYLIVPQSVNDKDLESVANFRYSRRIPTVVWRHRKNGCVIARSSQPEVGWLGWRNNQDEHLLQSIVSSCTSDEIKNKKLLILDARSYTAAVANRAKGGGCECPEYYLNSEVQFMSLANIHSIRKSFHSVRYICESPADQFNWLTLLDNSKWLHNISGLMKSALIVVNAIDIEERPVLVHCSDGWDRTPQIVALAELMLDPYYRTIEGFKVLIEREWIQFGHKFGDRCGHGSSSDDNERCPVFLQWLDCVHQLVRQFPCSFEFNLHFLIKIIQHTYSCLFGTFICNNMQERLDHQIYERTVSIWSYINNGRQQFVNYVYFQNDQVLRPSCIAKDIVFWSDVYMPLSSSICGTFLSTCSPDSAPNVNSITNGTAIKDICRNGILNDLENDLKRNDGETNVSNNETNETESDMDTIASDKHHSLLSKTRSCENIALEDDYSLCSNDRTRHCSDPNLFRLSIADQIEWEKGKCADILKYIRDLQTNGLAINREACDRDSNQVPLCRDVENGFLEETDVGLSAHFSMLSTETLLNGNTPFADNLQTCCENHKSLFSNVLTTSTSTTELSSSSVQSTDLSSQFDKLYHSVYCQKKKQTQNQSVQRQNSTETNNYNGKHTRTPSSGCPATPNDEQCLDVLPNEGSLSSEIFDIDGQVLLRDKALVRLQHIMAQHHNEIDYLKKELYMARLALCQQLKYCNGNANNDECSIANSTTHSSDYFTENTSLDSWIDVMPSLQTNRNGYPLNAKCDKNDSLTLVSEANNSTCDHPLNWVPHSDQLSLSHL